MYIEGLRRFLELEKNSFRHLFDEYRYASEDTNACVPENVNYFAKKEQFHFLAQYFMKYEEAFSIQLAFNLSNKLYSITESDIERNGDGKISGCDLYNSHNSEVEMIYFDLKIRRKSQNRRLDNNICISNFRFIKYINSMFVRLDFPLLNNSEFYYYQKVGQFHSHKYYLKPSVNYKLNESFNFRMPFRFHSDPQKLDFFEESKINELLKEGQKIAVCAHWDIFRTKIFYYNIAAVDFSNRRYYLVEL